MKLVIDASMALAWIFERQNKDEAACAERALLQLNSASVIVPSLWHTEIINALLVGERRKVITEAQIIDYLTQLYNLPFVTDNASVGNRHEMIMALAREHQLTSYNATYLDLALRENAKLASFDSQLVAAMQRAGGALF